MKSPAAAATQSSREACLGSMWPACACARREASPCRLPSWPPQHTHPGRVVLPCNTQSHTVVHTCTCAHTRNHTRGSHTHTQAHTGSYTHTLTGMLVTRERSFLRASPSLSRLPVSHPWIPVSSPLPGLSLHVLGRSGWPHSMGRGAARGSKEPR